MFLILIWVRAIMGTVQLTHFTVELIQRLKSVEFLILLLLNLLQEDRWNKLVLKGARRNENLKWNSQVFGYLSNIDPFRGVLVVVDGFPFQPACLTGIDHNTMFDHPKDCYFILGIFLCNHLRSKGGGGGLLHAWDVVTKFYEMKVTQKSHQ